MSTLRVSLLHLFLFLFPLPLPLCRSLHSPQPHDDPLLLLARTNNHPHLVPRTRFRSCNHNQRLSIQDAIIELRDLLRSAVGPSAPGLTPSPRAAFDDALTPGQRRFAFWFRLDNADQRRYVWQRFRALMAATEMVVEWPQGGGGGGRGGVGEGGGGGMFTFVCVDREGRCIRNPRMAGYISRADAGEFVICPYFHALPSTFNPTNRLSDRVSHLFYLFSHSRRVWDPPARDYAIGRAGPTNLTPVQARGNPICFIYFAKESWRRQYWGE